MKSSIGKKWLERFDSYYTSALERTPTLKTKTKELYLKNIERAKNEIWTCTDRDTTDRTLYIILHNPNVFFERLERYASKTQGRIVSDGRGVKKGLGEHSKDNLTSAVVSLFIHHEAFRNDHHATYEKWVAGQKTLRAPINDKYLTNKPTERQKSGYVPYEQVIEKRNTLEDGSPERLLLTLYTDIPPSRSDFYDARIYVKEPPVNNNDENYIVLSKTKGTLVLNKYKTSKKYGQRRIVLPPETLRQFASVFDQKQKRLCFSITKIQKTFC